MCNENHNPQKGGNRRLHSLITIMCVDFMRLIRKFLKGEKDEEVACCFNSRHDVAVPFFIAHRYRKGGG